MEVGMAKPFASEKLRMKFRKAIRKVPMLSAPLDPANPI
jgi:hypothetical protein